MSYYEAYNVNNIINNKNLQMYNKIQKEIAKYLHPLLEY